MVGQASSLSIRNDGQDARPTGNLSGFRGLFTIDAVLPRRTRAHQHPTPILDYDFFDHRDTVFLVGADPRVHPRQTYWSARTIGSPVWGNDGM